MRNLHLAGALAFAVLLAGCEQPKLVAGFAGTAPEFDPVRFFTGHVTSWGVIENRDGAPTAIVTTDCVGEPEGDGGLHMVQRLTVEGGKPAMRDWHLRRVAPHRYEATANDMVGTGVGETAGRVLHWRWTLAASPGNPLANVNMEQWFYQMDGGGVVIRTLVAKLGVVLIEVTEQFAHPPA